MLDTSCIDSGIGTSVTVTVKLFEPTFPAALVAVHVTVVVPIGKCPELWLHETSSLESDVHVPSLPRITLNGGVVIGSGSSILV